jgi:hypothetical protein
VVVEVSNIGAAPALASGAGVWCCGIVCDSAGIGNVRGGIVELADQQCSALAEYSK